MPYISDSLGSFRDSHGTDVDEESYLGDVTPIYAEWTMSVRTLGGVVTVWPFAGTDAYGKPAARFDLATYTALVGGGKLNTSDMQRATDNKQFAYVLAPVDVRAAATKLVDVTAAEAENLPGGISGWNPFANMSTPTKMVVGAAVVSAIAAVAGVFRGRR